MHAFMNVHEEVTTLRNTFVFKNRDYDRQVGGHESVPHKSPAGTHCTRTARRKGLVQAGEINPNSGTDYKGGYPKADQTVLPGKAKCFYEHLTGNPWRARESINSVIG